MQIICVLQVVVALLVSENEEVPGLTGALCVCVFSSLLSGRISTLRDETGAVSIAFVASYLKSRTQSAVQASS